MILLLASPQSKEIFLGNMMLPVVDNKGQVPEVKNPQTNRTIQIESRNIRSILHNTACVLQILRTRQSLSLQKIESKSFVLDIVDNIYVKK